jgi:RNA polymerase sigma-70 factor (ECF subfamily)
MTDWSQIVEEHGSVVWQTAYRLLDHEADAADCFQRTFMSALEVAARQAVQSWPALLRRLATARALEQLRSRIRSRRRSAELPEELAGAGRSPLEAAEAGELAEQLRQALTQIDARQAEVFCLACLESLSYQQVGEALGISGNHVGVLLNRARTSLQNRLAAFAPPVRNDRREVQP